MAEAAVLAPNNELLEWPKKDNRRFLHAVYRVGDLDRNIKFFTEALGMKVLRKRDIPEDKYSYAFLGFGPEASQFVVELVYNYGVISYDVGTDFGHFAITTQDACKLVENVRAKGGKIILEPKIIEVDGEDFFLGFAKDPDGCSFELLQRDSTPQPFWQLMLCVHDLDRSISFYEKALGMKTLRRVTWPDRNYAAVLMGYGDHENETAVLELTYNYGAAKYIKGNAYSHIVIGTEDVYKSAEVVKLVAKELGGKILPDEMNIKTTSFLDPDGWKIVLVDNQDFLKVLHSERVIAYCEEDPSNVPCKTAMSTTVPLV
ncbi:lactoylglutathione lyase GLX1-like [Ziziphus jujuba]|uniref:Lactoylglutathione lyase GLX1-like n=1 Tax=Ziziphus jujuba TaxID=326968 RepID=A0A6P3ZRC8_ZIZJJ|nr:lactoylglutathione lyase GLX1-like [Ziziphus jujuba]